MLNISDLVVAYGSRTVLQGISLNVAAGEVVAMIGRNGSGRSTLLAAIAGHVSIAAGEIQLGQHFITRWPAYLRARAGLAWVPENKLLFNELSVRQNLLLGMGPGTAHSDQKTALERIYALYSLLAERAAISAGALSGGEQQLLAFARALMHVPKVLLLDEPAEGLAPRMVEQMSEHLLGLKAQGVAILLVEQKLTMSTSLADRCLVLEQGGITFSGGVQQLLESQRQNP